MIQEIVGVIGLQWLSGGSYIDVPHATVVTLLQFIDAVLNCEGLKIIFPARVKRRLY